MRAVTRFFLLPTMSSSCGGVSQGREKLEVEKSAEKHFEYVMSKVTTE